MSEIILKVVDVSLDLDPPQILMGFLWTLPSGFIKIGSRLVLVILQTYKQTGQHGVCGWTQRHLGGGW